MISLVVERRPPNPLAGVRFPHHPQLILEIIIKKFMGKTGNPTFGIDEKLPRPKSLREFYNLVIKICPDANHSEDKFFDFVIESLKKPHIELQYRAQRQEIESERFEYKFGNRSLNEYWSAAEEYLKGLGVQKEKIDGFNIIMSRGFR